LRGNGILVKVVAYVDVFVDGVNTSSSLASKLTDLGAKVLKRLSPNVTHYVFKDGSASTLYRAKKGVLIISPSWIQRCDELKSHVAETDHLIDRSKIPPSTKKKKRYQPSPLSVLDPNSTQFSSSQMLRKPLRQPDFEIDDGSSDVDITLEKGLDGKFASLPPSKESENIDKTLQNDNDTSRTFRSRSMVSPSPERPTAEPELLEISDIEIEEKPKPKPKIKQKNSTKKRKRKKNI